MKVNPLLAKSKNAKNLVKLLKVYLFVLYT